MSNLLTILETYVNPSRQADLQGAYKAAAREVPLMVYRKYRNTLSQMDTIRSPRQNQFRVRWRGNRAASSGRYGNVMSTSESSDT